MSIQKAYNRIEADIERGDFGKARDRLHGLLSTYAGDLQVRRTLGDIYWKLHQPAMAGRYWYLEDATTPEMEIAKLAFSASVGNDPIQILLRLRFRGNVEPLLGSYAGEKLVELQEAAETRGFSYTFSADRKANAGLKNKKTLFEGAANNMIVLSLFAILILAVIGLITVIRWIL